MVQVGLLLHGTQPSIPMARWMGVSLTSCDERMPEGVVVVEL